MEFLQKLTQLIRNIIASIIRRSCIIYTITPTEKYPREKQFITIIKTGTLQPEPTVITIFSHPPRNILNRNSTPGLCVPLSTRGPG